ARLTVALIDVKAGVDLGALRRDLGLNSIDVIVHINTVGDRPFVVVLHHQILIEKAKRLFGWGSGETDEMDIEVLQHLAPEVVDGTVALVGNDNIESVDWDGRVVFYGRRFFEQRFQTLDRSLIGFVIQLLALEHRIEALNRADANPRAAVERVRGQALDDVFLVEIYSCCRAIHTAETPP